MYTDKALISDLECGRMEHYIIIKNVQRQNVIVYIIILSSSQELSQCLLAPTGAQEVTLSVRAAQVCLEHSIFIFLAHICKHGYRMTTG